jgi:hypothetical protein
VTGPRPKKNKYEITAKYRSTAEFLLVTKLGATLISESTLTQEEKETYMGLFDELKAAGHNLDDIQLDPFKYEDGIYEMALASVVLEPPRQAGWNYTLEFNFTFTDGKYRSKPYKIQHQIPTAENMAKDEVAETKRLTQTFQRLHQIGVKDPASVEVQEVNANFAGNRYMVPLETQASGAFKDRQFAKIIRPKDVVASGGGTSTSDLFDDDDND